MLDEDPANDPAVEGAVRLIASSRLFDEQWYAATAGCPPADRTTLIAHWVRQEAPEASPHPLFEPAWLYPGGRWRGQAPDPLSFYLSRPAARGGPRGPHPQYPHADLGPLEEWLDDHDPAELLADPVPRSAPAPTLVVVPGDDLVSAVRWVRHLARASPDVTVLVHPTSPSARRLLTSVAAALPSIRVGGEEPRHDVRVEIDAGVRAPRWSWLPELLAHLDRPGVDSAQPLLLTDDYAVAGPVLTGHAIGDAERLDGQVLPERSPGAVAIRVGSPSTTPVLAAGARLIVDAELAAPGRTGPEWEPLWTLAGFESPGRPITIREGRRALRWSVDIAAGVGGVHWGDYHFARSLAAALDRLGQWVTLEHPETRSRAGRALDDVTLTIRGLERVAPPPDTASLLWVISHPEDVHREEVAAYDVVFAASTDWSSRRSTEWGLEVRPLLQCTDSTRFHPDVAGLPDAPRVLFVANSRQQLRPSVAAALRGDVPLTVYGAGWDEWLPSGSVSVAAPSVANADLPALYAGSGVVLNDHWADMAAEGFVSNRIFDVLATGARLLTDEVAGLDAVPGLEGAAIPTWRDDATFARLADPGAPEHADAAVRRARAERVVAEHSFDARAATLLEAALGQVSARR